MRRVSLILFLIILALLMAACGGGEETPPATAVPEVEAPTEVPPTAVPPTEAPLAEVEPTAEAAPADGSSSVENVPDPRLVGVVWEWERRDPNGNSMAEIAVPNPENYTLQFAEDGTFAAKMDCNNAAGQYTTPSAGSIFMELGPSTLAACEETSLSDEMGMMFGPAQSYSFEEDDAVLVFAWAAAGPIDYYRNAEAMVEKQPGQEEIDSIPEDTIQMDLNGLADSFTWEVVPGTPIPPGPGGKGFPPHILLTFNGMSADQALADNAARMYIFPKDAYINLYNAEGNARVTEQVARLEELIASAEGRTTAPEGVMPLLPPPSSLMDRWALFSDLDFSVGSGVRYISDSPFRQVIGPWTNETIGYYYQGLTSDGVFYVSLYWPEATTALPNTDADVPADVQAAASNPDTYPTYLQETKDTLNATTPADWTPDLSSLDAMVSSLTFPVAGESAGGDLMGTTWHWVGTVTPVEEITVEDPTLYTILFNEDGSANIKADCNNVGATYTTDGSSLTIVLGPSTRAACGEDSLDQVYLTGLSSAANYFFQEGDLLVDMMVDGGTMRFRASEDIDLPEPEAGEATATVTAPDGIFIRTGPGTEYPDIGAAPFGETGTIVGVSEDGQWWVVEVPVNDKAPDGLGWISAQFVDAVNAANVPVVPAPELEPVLTGITWQWLSLTAPNGVTAVNDPTRYTILFNTDGTASIKADCNQVIASYTADAGSISIVPGPSTLAACPEDSLDAQYLAGLGAAAIYFFQDGDLYMDLTADAGTMRFTTGSTAAGSPTPAPTPSATPNPDSTTGGAEGILFNLVSFGPVGGQQPVIPGTSITATFSGDQVTGFAGCNDYFGSLIPNNDFFNVGPLGTTKKSCAEPAGIMEQESAYLAALQGTAGYEWVQELVGGTDVITAGQLLYLLPDGTNGIMNFIANK